MPDDQSECREVLPGFVGRFEATCLNEGVWRVRDDAGEVLVDDVSQATAQSLARILNSHGAVVEALKMWKDHMDYLDSVDNANRDFKLRDMRRTTHGKRIAATTAALKLTTP